LIRIPAFQIIQFQLNAEQKQSLVIKKIHFYLKNIITNQSICCLYWRVNTPRYLHLRSKMYGFCIKRGLE